VNHGFWKNRLNTLLQGRKIRNEVYTTDWFESRPANPVTILDFEYISARRRASASPVVPTSPATGARPATRCPTCFAGYALYDLAK
jgi:hypothetical protein